MVMDGSYDEAAAALFFVDILHGLAYLHSNFICHRNLKPKNILIDAKTKICKITDFGVSYFFEAEARVITPTASPTSSPERPLSKTKGTYCFCLSLRFRHRPRTLPRRQSRDALRKNCMLFDTMSPDLKSMLRMLLQRDHEKRAGVGDCLKHPFLKKAVKKRREDLSKELSECDRQPIKVSDAEKQAAMTHFSAPAPSGTAANPATGARRWSGNAPNPPWNANGPNPPPNPSTTRNAAAPGPTPAADPSDASTRAPSPPRADSRSRATARPPSPPATPSGTTSASPPPKY